MSKCEANGGSSVFARFRGAEMSGDTAVLSRFWRRPEEATAADETRSAVC